MSEDNHVALLDHAIRVVKQNPLGILCTVDADGAPHARWMAAVAVDSLARVYALTQVPQLLHVEKKSGLETRSVEQYRRLFSDVRCSEDFSESSELISCLRWLHVRSTLLPQEERKATCLLGAGGVISHGAWTATARGGLSG